MLQAEEFPAPEEFEKSRTVLSRSWRRLLGLSGVDMIFNENHIEAQIYILLSSKIYSQLHRQIWVVSQGREYKYTAVHLSLYLPSLSKLPSPSISLAHSWISLFWEFYPSF